MAKITKGGFIKALDGSIGTNREMSVRLKVTDSAITQYLDRNPDMRKLLDKQRLKNIDKAENEIFQQLDFEDPKSVSSAANIRQKASQFILKNLGKNQGWVEKTEQSVEHKGEQIKIIIEEKIPDGDKSSTKS